MDLTAPITVAILGVLLIGACLQGAVGFGLGTLASPIIAILAPQLLPGIVVFPALILTATVALLEHEHLDLKGTGYALVGRLPGALLGALVVLWIPPVGLVLVVAAAVLVGSLASISGWRPAATPRNVVVAGCVSGLMGTATGIGGPPMALVWTGKVAPGSYRATMATYFLVGTGVSCVLLLVTGAVDPGVLIWMGWTAPVMIAGVGLSRLIAPRLNRRVTRNAALVVSVGSSVVAVLTVLLS